MKNEVSIQALSSWIKLKQLIERENIYAPVEIEVLDYFLINEAKKTINGR